MGISDMIERFTGSHRITLKLFGVALLVLFLCVPLIMINSTLEERLSKRNEAVADITSSWGKEQVIVGPVLTVPYITRHKELKDAVINGVVKKVETTVSDIKTAWFLPDRLDISGEILPDTLHRGIYKTVVYSGALKFSGRFPAPSLGAMVREDDIMWDSAMLAFGITDLRGTSETLRLSFRGESFKMEPGALLEGFPDGIHAAVGRKARGPKDMDFSMDLALKGSGMLSFAPLGVQNTVKLSSPWPDPSFKGRFLPAERTVTPKGFGALWKISYYGRDYSQSGAAYFPNEGIKASMFGVELYTAVDSYRKAERAIKYGILFLTLVFAAFFIFEVKAALNIHILQYTLTGAAMCLFYLSLLSFSEFLAFPAAYSLASAAAVLMVTLYSRTVLRGGGPALYIGAELAAIYAFLYVTLSQSDYSLLTGTIGLLAALALIMYATRNLDWHSLDRKPGGRPPPDAA